MSLKKYALSLTVIVFIAMVSTTVYIFQGMWPEYENQFIEIALLDGNYKAVDYFPNDEHIVRLGTPIHWKIYLHNYRGVESRIKIVTRILNSTDSKPDDFKNIPAERKQVISHEVVLAKNEKMYIPVDWSIYDLHYNDTLYLDSILYNDNVINLDGVRSHDSQFIMVFELWVYSNILGDYSYTYFDSDKSLSSSVYMNFDALIR